MPRHPRKSPVPIGPPPRPSSLELIELRTIRGAIEKLAWLADRNRGPLGDRQYRQLVWETAVDLLKNFDLLLEEIKQKPVP